MRIDRGLLRWGVFLIVLGAVPLAVRAGYVDTDTVRRAWELWPLILIGIGLGLLLQRTQAAVVGGLIVSITFGLIGGSLLSVGVEGGFTSCSLGAGTEGTAFSTQTGSLGTSPTVDVELNCGELDIVTAAGSGWVLAGSDNDGQGPVIQSSAGRLQVRSRNSSGIGFTRGGDQWRMTLPTDPVTELKVAVNAASARLDLAGAHVPDVSVSVNAGDIRLDLSKAAQVGQLDASANAGSLKLNLPSASLTGSVSANAGSIDVCVPDGVGLRLRGSDSPLSSNNFDQHGLVKNGRTWTSPGYDTATVRIDLATSANAGSITLNPEAGCG